MSNLSTKDATQSFAGSGQKVTDGVYVEKKKILSLKDISGKKQTFGTTTFTPDLGLEVNFEGDRFPVNFMGDLKTDASGVPTGWGGAFVVATLFESAGISVDLNDKNRFNPDDVRSLINKEVYVVSYTAGTYVNKESGEKKNNYATWNITFGPTYESDEDLIDTVLTSWQKSIDKGYPKNYTLPMASDGTMSTKSGSNSVSNTNKSTASKSVATADVDFSEDESDDMPF